MSTTCEVYDLRAAGDGYTPSSFSNVGDYTWLRSCGAAVGYIGSIYHAHGRALCGHSRVNCIEVIRLQKLNFI